MRRLAVSAAVLVLCAGCGTAMTPAHLSPAFAEEFAGLYETQQSRVGRTDVTAKGLQSKATCARTGLSKKGPGEDWLCKVQYVDQDTAYTQSFEVQLKPDGCWRAEGPPTVQPAVLVDAVDGSRSTNPHAEFDGCLDTSWG
jgi:hypothetical protein